MMIDKIIDFLDLSFDIENSLRCTPYNFSAFICSNVWLKIQNSPMYFQVIWLQVIYKKKSLNLYDFCLFFMLK